MPSGRPGLVSTVLVACAAGMGALAPAPAHGYEFAIDAQTIGQGYQSRRLQPESGDVLLNRRRFTQTLRLEIWDLLLPKFDPAYPDKPRRAPFELSFTSSLRIDHDFGEYLRGDITFDDQGVIEQAPAYTLIPEMGDDRLALDVMYAYLDARGIGGGVLDLRLGRQLEIDTLDWFGFDGLGATVHTPWHLLIGAHVGLLTRSSSLWGSPTFEPDGTGSAACQRVEPGTTTWIDADECAQRDQLMPTYGLSLESDGLGWLHARVAWRRAQSPTSDAYPDAAPGWGVNEEKLSAEVSGNFFGGGVQPLLAVRQNFVLGLVDEARAGVRVAWRDHALTPEAVYSFPSFDGDSIFNVFSTEPYTDYRLTYDVWPSRGRLRGYARAFLRRFEGDDALGFGAGARLRTTGGGRVRLDLLHEDGYGGLRTGGDLALRWPLNRHAELEGRVTVLQFDDELRPDLYGTNLGAQAGVRWIFTDGVALHLLFEDNHNRIDDHLLRVIAVLDLAFRPEL